MAVAVTLPTLQGKEMGTLASPRCYPPSTLCPGVDLEAQGPQMFEVPATDITGDIFSRGDLEARTKLLLTSIAMDQAEQGQGP